MTTSQNEAVGLRFRMITRAGSEGEFSFAHFTDAMCYIVALTTVAQERTI